MSNKRGNKKHMTPLGQDFYALGSNSSASTSQVKLTGKRNEPFQSPLSMSPKRPKLNSPLSQSMINTGQAGISMLVHPQSSSSSSKIVRSWEEKAIVVPAIELKDKILEFDSENDSEEMIERLLCGAAKQLREQKTKPDSCLVFILLYLAKIRPLFFCSNIIVEAFSSLLKREHLIHFKSKNNMVPVLLINIFYHAFHDENSWPEIFIKLYVEDSLSDRIWVDTEECKEFVEIIVASFRTKLPPKSLLQTSDVLNLTSKHMESSPSLTSATGEDSVGEESCSSSTSLFCEPGRDGSGQMITSRYLDNENEIINYIYDIINENLNRRPTMNDISRNMLKLLIATAGLRNVRFLVAQKLEHWFQNPKLSRPAQDLLLTIFLNCDAKDIETLNYLLKMRLKNKPFVSHYILCFKELLNQKNGTFDIVLRILFNNEFSGIRNMNNIQLLSICFQQNSTEATEIMAKFYFSMIYSKEDHLRILRNLLREIVRTIKSEPINYLFFVDKLIGESQFLFEHNTSFDFSLKEKVISEMIDIITMTIFLSVNQNVRESFARPERKEIIRNFQMKISSIQCKAISWIHTIASNKRGFFQDMDCLTMSFLIKKIFILDVIDSYCKLDNWPSENERIIMYRVTSEGIPLLEESIQCIFSMAFNPEVPFSQTDALGIVISLINNAVINFDGDINYPVLLFKDLNIIGNLFQCCTYLHDKEVTLPKSYVPVKMVVLEIYWKVWFTMVIIGAHVPSIFGQYAWEHFPTFRALIEMAVTNCFQYPPKSMDTDDIQNQLQQADQKEKTKVLEFENYVSDGTEFNEHNSYLLPMVTLFEPDSLARRMSSQLLNDYKQLCINNTNYRLCYLLCQSRNPDFLLMIIDKQQSNPGSQISLSLNWLIDLVESYEHNYGLLPVQCLCEFLLKQIAEETLSTNSMEVSKLEKAKKKDKRRKLIRLIGYFQNEILQTSGNLSNSFQYLIRNLAHSQATNRMFSYKALYVIVSIDVEKYLSLLEENMMPSLFADEKPDWLMVNLIKFIEGEQKLKAICDAMNVALLEETDPLRICEYLEFISTHNPRVSENLLNNCSLLLIQRKQISTYIIMYSDPILKRRFLCSLCKIFSFYVELLLCPNVAIPDRIENSEYVYIKFAKQPKVILINSYLISAIILALSHVEDNYESFAIEALQKLFLSEYPQIYIDKEMKQQKPLIPEWLVQRLLCTNSNEVISLVLANLKTENLIQFFDSYGLSTTSFQRILQSLDKLTSAESRVIKTLNFDRKKLLNMLQAYWNKGIKCGCKFAKLHLNYKGDSEEKDDIEIIETSSKKREDKTEFRIDTFKKDEISKMFREKDFRKLAFLTRIISSELIDSNVKMKKMTKQFLNEFHDSIENISEHIVKGTFNSIFNVIIVSVLKDSKHYGLNQDLSAIKKSLQSFKSENVSIENTLLWKCFERLLYKENQKTKKSKIPKKKMVSKLSNALEEFLQKNVFKTLIYEPNENDDPWLEIYKDLAIEKYYKKDIDAENFNSHLKTVIFSRNRPYFSSLILDKSNLSTLSECVRFILDERSQLNPTTVLDFLAICIDLPKLWIGRENDSQKVVRYEDVLSLDFGQMKKLIDYVIMENDIANRIDLIYRTCCINGITTQMVIHFLKDYRDKSLEKISFELHTRLYLQIPNVGLNVKISDEKILLTQTLPCFMDKILHHLITAYMNVENDNNLTQQMCYFEDSMLKIASDHPLLFIRHLPMIPALLRGKVNVVNYDIFKSLNLPRIFNKLLNILNLLRPFLWNKNVKGLKEILDLYMEMFISYQWSRVKEVNHELLPLIIQFLHLIDDWVKHDSELSNRWIKQHKNDFSELSQSYSNEQYLFKSITAGLPLQDETQLIVTSQHYQTLQMNLRMPRLPHDVLVSTLNDINKMIDKCPIIGEDFLNSIQSYYLNPFVSDVSFLITLKVLKAIPYLSRTVISSYVRCLQSECPVVIKYALSILPELVILAQEFRYLLLEKVFELAVSGNVDASQALIETFRALISQIG